MKLLHLDHVEDLVFEGQFIQAIDTLVTIADGMTDGVEYPKHISVSTKFDGAPAIVFGVNPENGRFFVGTKSVFNKKIPKINYTKEDIEANHGTNIPLSDKLKMAYDCLKLDFEGGLFPKGVYQADLMYTIDSVCWGDETVYFTPNTITYHLPNTNYLVDHIRKSVIGMVVHTRYTGEAIALMTIDSGFDPWVFKRGSVLWIDAEILSLRDYLLSESDRKKISETETYVEKLWNDLKNTPLIAQHCKMMKMFINHCIRMGEAWPGVEMYRVFLKNRGEDFLAQTAVEQTFEMNTLFSIHRGLTIIKNIILEGLSLSSSFSHEVNGQTTKGEGFVATYHGVPVKLVDRLEFSRNNFANKKFEKAA